MSSVFEGSKLDFVLKPTLKHLSLVQITIMLWSQDASLIAEFDFTMFHLSNNTKWQTVENQVKEKALQLPLPKSLKDEVICFIKPIGFQLCYFLEKLSIQLISSEYVHTYVKKILSKVCWTCHGTIDEKRTAEVIMRDENLVIGERYALACIYCLEDDIPVLWNQVCQHDRYKRYLLDSPCVHHYEYMLIVPWTSFLEGKIDSLTDISDYSNGFPYLYAFKCAVQCSHKVACEHFWEKLTPEEKEQTLVPAAKLIAGRLETSYGALQNADVFCFLVSQMAEEQRMEFLKNHSYEVLICLLNWPRQDLFLKTAEHTWAFLSDFNCFSLLEMVVIKVTDGYSDFDYQQLFKILWLQSSDEQKKYVTEIYKVHSLFKLLFAAEDEANIRMILSYMSVSKREEFIFTNWGKFLCLDLICSNVEHRWDLLRMFISMCMSSNDEMIKFKNEIMLRLLGTSHKDKLNKFYQLIDDVSRNVNKRRNVEVENQKLKRVCDAGFDAPTCSKYT